MSNKKIIFCKVCKMPTEWETGHALKNDYWISADFPGDYSGPADKAPDDCIGQTMNINTKSAKLVAVFKCTECGRSIRA